MGFADFSDISRTISSLKDSGLSLFSNSSVKEFEKRLSTVLNSPYAVSLSSGTASLHIALAAANIKGEVLVPVFTHPSSVLPILYVGAIPVFVDINPETFTIDIKDLKKKITSRTSGIMVVHLFGHPAEMDDIMQIADDHDLLVFEDAAQAFNAEYRGKKVGTFGTAGCFSFQETKTITTFGEGGALITQDHDIYKKACILRNIGEVFDNGTSTSSTDQGEPPIDYIGLGYNYRISAVQAAMGISQIEKLSPIERSYKEKAELFFNETSKISWLRPPEIKPWVKHSFNYLCFMVDSSSGIERNHLQEIFIRHRIPAFPFIYHPIHELKIFAELCPKQSTCYFKNADLVSKNHIVFPTQVLTKSLIDYIVPLLRKVKI